MNTCKHCRHFDRHESLSSTPWLGYCNSEKINCDYRETDGVTGSYDQVSVGEDFGCIHFQPKGPGFFGRLMRFL